MHFCTMERNLDCHCWQEMFMSSEIRELQSKFSIILQALSLSARLYFQIGHCLVWAACFGALYLREIIETP